MVYKSDLLGLSTPSLTPELNKNEVTVKKEKKMKMKSNTVFQISLRDSVLSFASADKACEYVFQIRNKSSNFFHADSTPVRHVEGLPDDHARCGGSFVGVTFR